MTKGGRLQPDRRIGSQRRNLDRSAPENLRKTAVARDHAITLPQPRKRQVPARGRNWRIPGHADPGADRVQVVRPGVPNQGGMAVIPATDKTAQLFARQGRRHIHGLLAQRSSGKVFRRQRGIPGPCVPAQGHAQVSRARPPEPRRRQNLSPARSVTCTRSPVTRLSVTAASPARARKGAARRSSARSNSHKGFRRPLRRPSDPARPGRAVTCNDSQLIRLPFTCPCAPFVGGASSHRLKDRANPNMWPGLCAEDCILESARWECADLHDRW